MGWRLLIAAAIVIAGVGTNCHALDCVCSDWMNKGGYCVDYVKEKIPEFPIPQNTTEIASLKNKEISEISEGDVAMFNFSNYWHVAYVEQVNRGQDGVALSIDVSEMNFGDRMSFDEFRDKWKSKDKSEWKRAVCCGITDKYDQKGFRENVSLNMVKQIWSPDSAEVESAGVRRTVVTKVREALNRLFDFKTRDI